MNLFEKISEWWSGKLTPYESPDFGGLHYEIHWTARLFRWFFRWNVLATIGVFIVGAFTIIGAIYTVRAFYFPPNPQPQKTTQPHTANQSTELTNKNPTKRDSDKLAHAQKPPIKKKPSEIGKSSHPKQEIVTNNPKQVNQPTKQPELEVGKDSVVMGNVPPNTRVGDGSVVIGPTDNRGNTIINTPMAVGRGAQAGPGSIAIGANAGAGLRQDAPTETKPQK